MNLTFERNFKKRTVLGLALIFLSFSIVGVSAFVYESAQQTISQTTKDIATINLGNSALGNLEEGETKSYTKATVATLGAAIKITTTKANVYLHLDSDLDSLTTYYTTYTVRVKYATIPAGSSHSIGQTAATMTLVSPDPSAIALDVAGSWTFDLELTTTAKSVSSDHATTATIVVTAESTA